MTQRDESADDVLNDNDTVNERRPRQFGRRRNLTVALGAVALAAALVAGIELIRPSPSQHASGTDPSTTVSPTDSTEPSPTTEAPEPTTLAPSPSIFDTPTVAATTKGPMPADLHLSGPHSLTLTASGGKYHGTLTMTLRNTGPTPYGQTVMYLSYPDGVRADTYSEPMFAPCLLMQGHEPWVCVGQSVPARGGEITITWTITVDYAPGPAMTLSQPATFRAVARSLTADEEYRDPTPTDNKISITLKLAAAS